MRKDAAPPKFVAFAKNLPKGKISLDMSVCLSVRPQSKSATTTGEAFHENSIRVV